MQKREREGSQEYLNMQCEYTIAHKRIRKKFALQKKHNGLVKLDLALNPQSFDVKNFLHLHATVNLFIVF
jgi:hypothetical protein